MAPSPDPAVPARPHAAVSAALALLAVAVLIVHLQRTLLGPGASLLTFDSAEYALAGRELAETGRLMTPFVHPAALHAGQHPPFPLLAGHPLVPVLDAVLFRVAGVRAGLTLVPSVAGCVVLVLAAAWLGFRVARSNTVALAAGLAILLSPWTLRFATEGLSEIPFAALVTLALVVLAGFARRPRPILLGALLGLAHLTRPVLVPMLPAWILGIAWLAPAGARGRTLGLVLLGFAPFAVALALYKAVALGSPLADVGGYLLLASLTPDLAVARLNRMMPPPAPLPFLAAHPAELTHKVLHALPSVLYQVMNQIGRPLTVWFALRAVVRTEAPARPIYPVTIVAAALLALLAAFTVPDPRMVFPLLPAIVVLALDGAWRLMQRARFPAPAAVAVCLALALVTPVPRLFREWRDARTEAPRGVFLESEWRGLGAQLATHLPGHGVVASDAAPWIAWFTHRPVTLVPLAPADLAELARRTDLDAMVLTNEWLIRRPGEEPWLALFEGRARVAGWAESARLRSGRLEAVVLRREGVATGGTGPVRNAELRHDAPRTAG
jgi:hypothetical protein